MDCKQPDLTFQIMFPLKLYTHKTVMLIKDQTKPHFKMKRVKLNLINK